MPAVSDPVFAAIAAFAATVCLTPVVIRVAHAKGLVAQPRADRWHKTPTALFGGIAIWAAITGVGILVLPPTAPLVGILVGTAVVFGVGLVDDRLRIKPSSKLIGQIAAACIAVLAGVQMEAIAHPFLAIPLTVFWIVAITNAFNLIDNMDGLSAGVAAISAAFVVAFALLQGNEEVAVLAAVVGGAASGFLVFNFNPARVFMGDCGSMVLGYTLACASLLGTWHQASNLFLILAAPALLLAVPIFDATLVTVLRTFAGRPISQGGRDHSSHRLVALGLSERRAVLTLYAVCVSFGAVALLALRYNLFAAAVGALLLVVGIFFFGVFLGQVPVYGPAPAGSAAAERAPAVVNTLLLHKRRIAEVGVDFVLICAAYASAYLLRFEGAIPPQYGPVILQTLPLLIVLKLAAFFLFGVYRGVWKYVGIRDAVNLAKAVTAGSVATVIALVLAYRFENLSRSVFVLDGLLLLFYAAGARVLLRVFRETLVPVDAGARRLLIVGAGDGGEMLLRELRNDPALGLTAVGLVDDDPEKRGRQVHGVTVLGSTAEIEEIAARTGAEEIAIAVPSVSGTALARIAARCAATGLPVRTTRRLTELVDGQVTPETLRDLDLLDVVQRRPTPVEDAAVRAAIEGRAVVVLGAGGTLGSAIARRLLSFAPARVLLVDRDDNAVTRLRESFARFDATVRVAMVDVAHGEALARRLESFRPDVVVHAAAVNQPAVVDENPGTAVRVDVGGVDAAARAARRAGAKVFVLASSVKAGWTATTLGAIRRLGELAAMRHHGETLAVRVVRLGNVLGSRGGLLARFRDQALAGGPITLTDADASRFMLAAEEAASSVLAAAGTLPVAPPAGAVLMPDHGPQVRVEEIAHAVVDWVASRSGRDPARTVELALVGLRPGEPLRDPEPADPRTGVIRGLHAFVPAEHAGTELEMLLERIEAAASGGDDARVRELLAAAFPALEAARPPADKVVPLRRGG